MLKFYLVDLTNKLIELDNKSIPIGIGYVAAYCKQKFGEDFDLQVFRTIKPLKKRINDCFTFFRYMNSVLMRRTIGYTDGELYDKSTPDEPWRRELRQGQETSQSPTS
jgi:hypothetical protein